MKRFGVPIGEVYLRITTRIEPTARIYARTISGLYRPLEADLSEAAHSLRMTLFVTRSHFSAAR